jgi:hypothetical protein
MGAHMTFQAGQKFRNRKGEFTVLRLEGETMIIRYTDGRMVRTPVAMQERIWQSIQDEELLGAEDVDIEDDREGEGRKTEAVRDLVARALRTIPQPWPTDVTDQVCLAIERRPDWLREYHGLVKELGALSVNSSLGAHVKDLTNMENAGREAKSKSHLIKSYSLLVPTQQ